MDEGLPTHNTNVHPERMHGIPGIKFWLPSSGAGLYVFLVNLTSPRINFPIPQTYSLSRFCEGRFKHLLALYAYFGAWYMDLNLQRRDIPPNSVIKISILG